VNHILFNKFHLLRNLDYFQLLLLKGHCEEHCYRQICAHNQNSLSLLEVELQAGHQWLTPVILATQEAAIRRIAVQSQYGQIVL
jgi:hypothetical protein